MKFFLDTANLKEITEVASWGILDGVTTNPSLCSKENMKFEDLVTRICHIVKGPVSLECVSTLADDIVPEARQLAQIADNVVIKIPITIEGLKAIKILSQEDIAVNTTLIFSAGQALLAAKAGARYVSPFIGRLDDQGELGMSLIREIVTVISNYDFKCEVLVASIRHPIHVTEAAMIGADICTVPFDVLKKMVGHSLTDVGIERFKKDWSKVPK